MPSSWKVLQFLVISSSRVQAEGMVPQHRHAAVVRQPVRPGAPAAGTSRPRLPADLLPGLTPQTQSPPRPRHAVAASQNAGRRPPSGTRRTLHESPLGTSLVVQSVALYRDERGATQAQNGDPLGVGGALMISKMLGSHNPSYRLDVPQQADTCQASPPKPRPVHGSAHTNRAAISPQHDVLRLGNPHIPDPRIRDLVNRSVDSTGWARAATTRPSGTNGILPMSRRVGGGTGAALLDGHNGCALQDPAKRAAENGQGHADAQARTSVGQAASRLLSRDQLAFPVQQGHASPPPPPPPPLSQVQPCCTEKNDRAESGTDTAQPMTALLTHLPPPQQEPPPPPPRMQSIRPPSDHAAALRRAVSIEAGRGGGSGPVSMRNKGGSEWVVDANGVAVLKKSRGLVGLHPVRHDARVTASLFHGLGGNGPALAAQAVPTAAAVAAACERTHGVNGARVAGGSGGGVVKSDERTGQGLVSESVPGCLGSADAQVAPDSQGARGEASSSEASAAGTDDASGHSTPTIAVETGGLGRVGEGSGKQDQGRGEGGVGLLGDTSESGTVTGPIKPWKTPGDNLLDPAAATAAGASAGAAHGGVGGVESKGWAVSAAGEMGARGGASKPTCGIGAGGKPHLQRVRPAWGTAHSSAKDKGSPSKGVPGGALEAEGDGGAGAGGRKGVKRALDRLHEDPPPRTNTLAQMRQFVQATDEKWQRARKAQHWHFRGSAEDEKTHNEAMATFRQRRGLDQRKIAAVCGGNKTARETLWEHDCQECPEGDLETTNFDVRWTINHNDINFAELRPNQMCNHFPNSGIEVGSKVGLARNLRSLEWFDKIDMHTFFPRMYNLANPWEMQDFVEDFIFTAAHLEMTRFTQGLCVTAAVPPDRGGMSPTKGSPAKTMCSDSWREGVLSEAASRKILEAAHQMCELVLDNRKRLKRLPQDPRAVAQGVVNLSDYWHVRPDLRERAERELGGGPLSVSESCTLQPAACAKIGRWASLGEEEVAAKIAGMMARLRAEHVQLDMDGLRNIWIVKPGHGSRGRGIRVLDDLQAIISFATSRKKSAIAQKYIENCLTLDKKKFDIRFWVLVSNWNPLTVWCYEPYFRLCTEDHTLDRRSLSNQFQHLCNRCVQEHHDGYESEDGEDGMMWSVQTFIDHLSGAGHDGEAVYESIRSQCQQVALCSGCTISPIQASQHITITEPAGRVAHAALCART